MSITIEGFEKAQDVSQDPNYLQNIPAKVVYEGPANVKNYFTNFTSNVKKDTKTPLSNVFRGRPLNGKYKNILAGKKLLLWATHLKFMGTRGQWLSKWYNHK